MEKRNALYHHTMTYGAILGTIQIIMFLVMYFSNIMLDTLPRIIIIGLLTYAVIISFMIYGARSYRDKLNEGAISYGEAIVVSMLILVFASILSNFFTLIFNKFIDSDYQTKVFESYKNWYYNFMVRNQISEEQIEQMMNKFEQQQPNENVIITFLKSIFASGIIGFVISLITSAFIKRVPNPFNQQ